VQRRAPISARNRPGILASEPLLLAGLVILTLYFARDLIAPLAFALVLNFLLAPAVGLLEGWRLRRAPAVVLVILIFFSGVGATAWIVARQLVYVAEMLPDYRDNIQAKLDSMHTPVGGAAGKAITSLEEMTVQLSSRGTLTPPPETAAPESRRRRTRLSAPGKSSPAEPTAAKPMLVQIVDGPVSPTQYLQEIFGPILHPLLAGGIVMIFTIYMLMNREDLRNRMLLLAGMGRLNLMTQALADAADRISRFLVWQFVVNVLFGITFGVGLRLIGVPDATLWGTLAAILRYVPYVGTAAAGLLPLVFSIAIFPNWRPTFEILGFYATLEITTANFVEPWLYGSRVGVSALALLASAIFWSLLWGWSGLMLATPLTVCLIVMGRHVPQLGFLHVLLGDEAELAPQARFYERLLAMDQAEAHNMADRFLAEHSLVEFYDLVLLPALGLEEQDRHKGGLEEARGNFVMLSVTELIAELSEHKSLPAPAPLKSRTPAPATSDLEQQSRDQHQQSLDQQTVEPAGRAVICVPAGDQADELCATMLAQLLEQGGHSTMLLPTASVTTEILERLGEDTSTILCIAALPPFVFTQTRTLCQTIREHLPENRIMIGLWQSTQDTALTRERFGSARPDYVVTTLAAALHQIQQWQSPGAVPAGKASAGEQAGTQAAEAQPA
jgi:predicted PurR-regulated permease PerM